MRAFASPDKTLSNERERFIPAFLLDSAHHRCGVVKLWTYFLKPWEGEKDGAADFVHWELQLFDYSGFTTGLSGTSTSWPREHSDFPDSAGLAMQGCNHKKKNSLRTQDNLSSRTLYLAYFQCSWRIFEAKISGSPVQHLLFPFPPPLLFLLLALAGFTPHWIGNFFSLH